MYMSTHNIMYIITRAAERIGTAQGKYKSGTHNIDRARGSGGTPPGNVEVLHVLKCVRRALEAPFVVCIDICKLVFQLVVSVRSKSRGPS